MKTKEDIERELPRILEFVRDYVYEEEKVVIPVSGGLDSDVVARLCCKALGRDRIHIFTVHQPHMEEKYLKNVENLGKDLGVAPVMIDLGDMNTRLIQILSEADSSVSFHSDSLLDPARANCSLRTAVFSSYQDKGFLVAANSNRSEIELGFYMPFGDNMGHFKPIAHLYKSEVRYLAELVGSRAEVIAQSPSAGFWEGEEDMEDMAFWFYNGGPIAATRVFTDEECDSVMKIKEQLTQLKVDTCLEMLAAGKDNDLIEAKTGLSETIVQAIRNTVQASARLKNRNLLAQLERD